MYAQSGVVQVDWNERFGSTVDIGTGAGNGDVYRRFQDIDGGSNSSASNDTESTTLLDETVRKHERLYDITPPAPHNGGGFCMKIFLGLCFSALIMCTVFMNIISTGNDRGRVGEYDLRVCMHTPSPRPALNVHHHYWFSLHEVRIFARIGKCGQDLRPNYRCCFARTISNITLASNTEEEERGRQRGHS